MSYDLIIVGGGPGGAAAAIVAARSGARVLVLERAIFPREKVCGDCLIPECWQVLDRLGVMENVKQLPHVELDRVSFVSRAGQSVNFAMSNAERGEFAVRRRDLDHLLLQQAAHVGAEVLHGAAVTELSRESDHWTVRAESPAYRGRYLLAADGRNSTIAHLLGLRARPRPARDRVGLQARAALPPDLARTVQLRSLRDGYAGLAAVGEDLLNISLAGRPDRISALRAWAESEFGPVQEWRTIAPLARRDFPAAHPAGCFLVGDAARVVEPFTGEGVYYAMRSGELAAQAVIALLAGHSTLAEAVRAYREAHRRLYRGRLWVNRLARAAVLHPRLAGLIVRWSERYPALLRTLTSKVVGPLCA